MKKGIIIIMIACMMLSGCIVNRGILGDVGEIVYFDETNPDGKLKKAKLF